MGLKPRKSGTGAASAALRRFALTLPEAWEDHPWGENVTKVGKKVFVFFGRPGDGKFGMSVKLPDSGAGVLCLPFAEPTGYGLGKAGWVTITCAASDLPPLELLEQWVVESYRAVAGKKQIAQLGA